MLLLHLLSHHSAVQISCWIPFGFNTHAATAAIAPTLRALQGERDSKEEIAKVFALFDHDGGGKITFRDLKRVVTELGENISDEEMREMIGTSSIVAASARCRFEPSTCQCTRNARRMTG